MRRKSPFPCLALPLAVGGATLAFGVGVSRRRSSSLSSEHDPSWSCPTASCDPGKPPEQALLLLGTDMTLAKAKP